MLFNSIDFIVFFVIAIIFYYILPNKIKNGFLLLCSYYFYGCWNYNYLILLLITTVTAFLCGMLLGKKELIPYYKLLVFLVCMVNFGLLFVFKYYNFFSYSINSLFESAKINQSISQIDFLLPVGISFYTFQAIGYVIDVYRGKVKPENNIITFALYVSFFPQLVAGPIERSYNLLPQFLKERKFHFDQISQGFYLMIWGFFLKVVIADRLALYVDSIYSNIAQSNYQQLILAAYFFSFQIYCDFAGYSFIAIGAAKIMNIELMNNFNKPYFATSIRDFWRRWHISLSTWFRDYLYLPLGGNRVSNVRIYINILIVFFLCGLWHGAAWSYVVWGGLHGFLLCVNRMIKENGKKDNIGLKFIKALFTFHLVTFVWIFFRAINISDAFKYIKRIIFFEGNSTGLLSNIKDFNSYELGLSCILIVFLLVMEFFQSGDINYRHVFFKKRYIRWPISYLLILFIIVFGVFKQNTFIYFQF